jgi:hypothetical protein
MTKLRRKARLVSVCACDVGQTSASFTRRGEKKHLKAKEKALHSSVFNYNLFNHETTNAKLYTDERKMFEFLWHDIRTCSVAMGEGKKAGTSSEINLVAHNSEHGGRKGIVNGRERWGHANMSD